MSTPIGWIVHYSSRKLVHPYGGSWNPDNDTNLVVHEGGLGESRLQFQFEVVEGQGHFGYIKHVPSGKYVHPLGGSIDPGKDTQLVYHDGKHSACLFCFDEENNYIVHISNKIWHPYGGLANPSDDTGVVLHGDRNVAATFMMTDASGNKISPYGDVKLTGDYKLLQATIDPQADHTFELTVERGEERTETSTEHHAWGISGGGAFKIFSASAEYSRYAEEMSSETWSKKTTVKRTIFVKKGKTVATWQYNFGLSQLGDVYGYSSSIVRDTDDPHNPPKD